MTQPTKKSNPAVTSLVMAAAQTAPGYGDALARAEEQAPADADRAEINALAEGIWRSGVAAQMRRIGAMATPGSEIFRLGEALTGTGENKIKRYQVTMGGIAKEKSSSRGLVAFLASSKNDKTGQWEENVETARTDMTRNSDIARDFANYLADNAGIRGFVTLEMEPMGGSEGRSVRVIKNFEPIGPDEFFNDKKAALIDDKLDEMLSKR